MMNSITALCTFVVIFVSTGINSLPIHFTVVHGKRSLGMEPKAPEKQFSENLPLKNFQGYLEPEYDLVEDESSFRRNQPEVPSHVGHMFGRTLNDRDLEANLLENYGLSDTRSINDIFGIPEGNKVLRNRLLDGAGTMNTGYPVDWRPLNRKSSQNEGLTNNDIYRYLIGLTNHGSQLSDDNDDIIRSY